MPVERDPAPDAPDPETEGVVAAIEEAARLLRDSNAGYLRASEGVEEPELRSTLVEMAARRRVLADEVVRQAVESGVWVRHTGGSLEGRVQRGLLALESVFGDDLTVLRSVRGMEGEALEDLTALEIDELPGEVRTAVADGRDHISTCIAALDALLP